MNKRIPNGNFENVYNNRFLPVFAASITKKEPEIHIYSLDDEFNNSYIQIEDGTKIKITNTEEEIKDISYLPDILMCQLILDMTGDTVCVSIVYDNKQNEYSLLIVNTFLEGEPKKYLMHFEGEDKNE